MRVSKFALLAILGSQTLLAGCAPLVVGGMATGASVAHDRRTAGTVLEDQNIELKTSSALSEDPELHEQGHINVTSYNLNVLLSGEVPTGAMKQRAERLARDVARVRRVYNELAIAAPSSMMSRSSDTLITGKVKTKLFGVDVPGFDPTRVKVVTERGTVYLMGLVTRQEADAAVDVARGTGGVQKVVKLFEYRD